MFKSLLLKRCFLALSIFLFLASIACAETLLLFDDFSDGSLLNPPENVSNPRWRARHYYVPIPVDDGSGNMVLSIDGGVSIYPGDREWTDYEVEVKFRVLSNDFYCLTMNLRYNRDNEPNSYRANLLNVGNPTNGQLVYQIADNNQTYKNHFFKALPLDVLGTDWHTMSVKIVGNSMTGYLDGEEILSCEIKPLEGATKGSVRFYIERHGGTSGGPYLEIDHIKITEL